MYEGRAELRTAALTVIPRGGTNVLVAIVRARPILESPDPFGFGWDDAGDFTMNLTAFVPVADPTLPVGLRHDTPVPDSDVQLPMSTLSTVSVEGIRPLEFEILARRGSTRRLRLFARSNRDITLACTADFAFRSDIDYSKADWNDFVRDEYAVSLGGGSSISEAEWLYTDRLRRMCQEAFPILPSSGESPQGRGSLWRWFAQTRLPALPRRLVVPSERQCQYLKVALIAVQKPDCPTSELAQAQDIGEAILRSLESESTAADEALLHLALEKTDPLEDRMTAWLMAEQIDHRSRPNFTVLDCFPEHSREACDAVRDILGNPFRPVNFDPRWRTALVTSLAREMARSRDHSAMPVLADALEDAGCTNETVLRHARGDRPHFPGCWLVEAVLSR